MQKYGKTSNDDGKQASKQKRWRQGIKEETTTASEGSRKGSTVRGGDRHGRREIEMMHTEQKRRRTIKGKDS